MSEKIKILEVKLIERLNYLKSYEIDYEAKDGSKKKWELVSRDGLNRLKDEIYNHKSYTDGVMIFAVDRAMKKVVMLKEFRVSAGQYVYTLPAGLIDPGESLVEASQREFKEETGLELSVDSIEKERYTSVGIINEKVNIAYGYFSGEPTKKYQENSEDAEIVIVDKAFAENILANEEVTIRSALLIENYFKLNRFMNE